MAGTIKITFDGRNGRTGPQFKRGVTRFAEKRIKAIQETARITAVNIENAGRADIARAGNFSSARWQLGLRAFVSYQSRSDLRIRVTHAVKYWRVFEYAPTIIRGDPLLWIPLDFAGIPTGLRARDFPEPLFRVDRQGKAPLLLSATGPKYFGKPFVTIRTKWHLRDKTRQQAKKMPRIFEQQMKKG